MRPCLLASGCRRSSSTTYDPGPGPVTAKAGVLIGMAMTEKQGGSDVRANATEARALGDGAYELIGHKWFCSAPMSDELPDPRPDACRADLLPGAALASDGARNTLLIQRLKDKLGNRSNASAEIEYATRSAGWWARRAAACGPSWLEVHHTRLDIAVGVGGPDVPRLDPGAASRTPPHRLPTPSVDHPLMPTVLADLALEVEAATALAMRLARAFDGGAEDVERGFCPRGHGGCKYWVLLARAAMIAEPLECLGGNGYVEESILPRLYRRRRSTRSGRGRAAWSVWTFARALRGRTTWRRCARSSTAPAAPICRLDGRLVRVRKRSPIRARSRPRARR